MVAKITSPHSIQRALNYNEQKVKNGHAELLHAANYLKDTEQLNFYDKLQRFKDLISLNERPKTNTLHISLNFHNSDMLSKEKITEIAVEYMDKIGFGEQPFLIYQHFDAGHPHLHIVTTNIQANGKRIDTFNIGRNQSEKARKELEQKFRLVQAMGRKISGEEIKPISQKMQYGKSETRRTISNVLAHVLNDYKYSSLAELNAVLRLYNVVADRGSENSRIYQNNGLVYRVLDANGNKIGVPIKSSLIYNKPGLKFLEQKFQQNEPAKQQYKQRLKFLIDRVFTLRATPSMQTIIDSLRNENIAVILRQNKEGFLYGITYIDHKNRCVFNGSDLGKEYSAHGLQKRCVVQAENKLALRQHLVQRNQPVEPNINPSSQERLGQVLNDLITPEMDQNASEPFEQRQFKKKKSLRQRL